MPLKRTLIALALACAGIVASSGGAEAAEHEGHTTTAKKAVRAPEAVLGPAARFSSVPTPHFDATGRLWVAFVEGDAVYVASSKDRGKSFGSGVRLTPEPEKIDANGEARPKLVVAPNGNILVSWTQALGKPHTGNVRFSRSTDGGRSFSKPVTLNDDGLVTGHRFDTLGVGPRGEVVVAWVDKRDREKALELGQKYEGAAIYYAISQDGGLTFAPNRKLKDYACECCRLALAFDAQGVAALVWRDILPGGIRDHSLARLSASASDTSPARATFDDWKISACPHHGPSLSVGSDGTYHLGWFTGDGRRGGGVFYARSTSEGRSFDEPQRFGNPESAGRPTVLALGNRVWLAWKEFKDGVGTVLLVTASRDGGTRWDAPRTLATTRHDSDHPFLLSNGKDVFASWFSSDEGYRLLPATPLVQTGEAGRPTRR
jgi:hypothetical protein